MLALMRAATATGLWWILSCASAPQPEPRPAVQQAAPAPPTIAELALGPGLGLGSSLAEIRAAAPDLALTPPSARADERVSTGVLIRSVLGIEAELSLRFFSGRLYEISLRAAPRSVSGGAFARLNERYEAALGVPERTRCTEGPRTDDVPALLRSSWRGERWTRVELSTTPSGPALEASEHHSALAPPPISDELDGTLIQGRFDPARPRPSCAERRARARAEAGAAHATSRPDPGCRVDLQRAPAASLYGLRFGASRTEVEALTGPLPSGTQVRVERPLLGEPAVFTLHFYEGCLAALSIEVLQANLARYQALSPALVEVLGPGAEQRCTVAEPGGPPRRSASTTWRGRPDLEADLRLEAAFDCPEEDHVAIGASYPPLRRYAPRYDF